MKSRVAVAASLCSSLLLGAPVSLGSIPRAHAAVSLSFLAIRKTDLPPGYKQIKAKSNSIQSDAHDAGLSVATLRARGWQGSYDAAFDFKAPGVLGVEIESNVARYRSAADAAWFFQYGLRQSAAQASKMKFRLVKVLGLGDQAAGYTLTEMYKKVPVEVAIVGFRQGSYLGTLMLTIGGPKIAPPVKQAQFYAQVMDDHIRFS